MRKKIIVSLTSWPKRIGNVAEVVKSLLLQDLEPDIIQINLSIDEFKNGVDDLPDELKTLLEKESRVEIEWVNGNDGVFKKIIPTLKKHQGEEYLLLSVDDDWLYRHDYIKIMVENLEKRGSDSFCLSHSLIIGNRMIYKSSVFDKDFWEKLTPEVVSTRIDDAYIEHYMRCKNKKKSCYRPNDVNEIMKTYNPVHPNSHNTKTGFYSQEDINRANFIINEIQF